MVDASSELAIAWLTPAIWPRICSEMTRPAGLSAPRLMRNPVDSLSNDSANLRSVSLSCRTVVVALMFVLFRTAIPSSLSYGPCRCKVQRAPLYCPVRQTLPGAASIVRTPGKAGSPSSVCLLLRRDPALIAAAVLLRALRPTASTRLQAVDIAVGQEHLRPVPAVLG